MSAFTTPADLRMLDNYQWELLTEFDYHVGSLPCESVIRIPAGTITELASVPVPHPSETVRKYTGTPSVSEAAALLAAGAGMDQLIVEKLRYRGPDGRNATVSIARIPT